MKGIFKRSLFGQKNKAFHLFSLPVKHKGLEPFSICHPFEVPLLPARGRKGFCFTACASHMLEHKTRSSWKPPFHSIKYLPWKATRNHESTASGKITMKKKELLGRILTVFHILKQLFSATKSKELLGLNSSKVRFAQEYKEWSTVWGVDYCAREICSCFSNSLEGDMLGCADCRVGVGRGRGSAFFLPHRPPERVPLACMMLFLSVTGTGIWNLGLLGFAAKEPEVLTTLQCLSQKKNVPAQMLFMPHWEILCPSKDSSLFPHAHSPSPRILWYLTLRER